MASLTSTLDIILKDDVSARASTIEAALKKMEAEAKQVDAALGKSGTSDKFQANLKKIGASAAHVEAATRAWKDYAAAEGLAAGRGDWTAKQIAGVKNWESVNVASIRAVMSAEKALQAQQHARVEAQHREMERVAHQREHGEAHHGFANYALQTAAMAVSAHAIVHGIEATLEHGAEYQHKLVALQNTGRTPEEIAEINRASHSAIRGVPTTTLTENLEILTETVGAFGSVEHAMEHLPFMAKSAAMLHSIAGDKISESAGQMGNAFAKFFEMRGTAGNGEVFEHEASEMMKSMVFTGGNVNPRELLNFAQQAKASLQNYSIDFLSRIAPSLIGEVGGDRAGTQANAFNSVLLGKANDAKQAAAWLKYGLIDPKQMTGKGDKMTGWTGGAIYHTDEFLRNPLEAIEKYMLPAFEKKGVNINDPLELTKVLGTLFRNINAAAFANELANPQNRARLHKDAKLLDKIETPDAMYKRLLTTDPTFALVALKASLGNFLTTLSSPVMEPAARTLSGMAENLNNLALVAHDNPVSAVTGGLVAAAGALGVAGKLSYGLVNGFGGTIGRGIAAEIAAALPAAGHVGAAAAIAEGGLTVGALEVAATAGVTLTAGTVALVGITAAALMAALVATTPPKKHASDDPNFGNPFAPGKGIDFNDPKLQEKADDDKKPWYNRNKGAQPRGAGGKYDPTTQPGEWVKDPHGGSHYVQYDMRGPKVAPYFSTAPLGPDGRIMGMSNTPIDREGRMKNLLPFGWTGDKVPTDPSTGTIIGLEHMPTDPRLYQPSDMPLPPRRPAEFSPPPQTFDPLATPMARNPEWGGPFSDPSGIAQRPGDLSAVMNPAPMATVVPQVDTSALDAATQKAGEAHAALDGLNVSVSPAVSLASLDALIARANEARAAVASIGSVNGANATISSVGRKGRSFQSVPMGTVRV